MASTLGAHARLWLLLISLLSGCSFLRPARTPMRFTSFVQQGPQHSRGAIVLLPGFGDRPTTFHRRGFVAALRRAAPRHDVFAADAHFTYYRKGMIVERLARDVIGPLRARGYRNVWLAGASMGGMGALAYARSHPGHVQGLMLFAPYLGPRDVVEEVERAGGLCMYQARDLDQETERGAARANFAFLREQLCGKPKLPVWLGVGRSDRLFRANALVGTRLPAGRFVVLPGGHGWQVWTPLVEHIASRALPE